MPFEKPRVFVLASLAASEIALRIRQIENYFRPDWHSKPYIFEIPPKVEDAEHILDEYEPFEDSEPQFDRTLVAYSMAYRFKPHDVRYLVSDEADDTPQFCLLDPARAQANEYTAKELLAVFRSLRYDDRFASVTFEGVSLDVLNEAYDRHGGEHVAIQGIHGLSVKLPLEKQQQASLLLQEVRALAISNKKLRRLNFAYSVSTAPTKLAYDGRPSPGNCAILEALFPLCKAQATNVDWLSVNGIQLQDSDLDYLFSVAAEKSAHFRAIEVSDCGLTERGVSLLLDVLKTHENTLEALNISSNPLRLLTVVLPHQLKSFTYLRKLNLAGLNITASDEPLLPLEMLSLWRLDLLDLTGIPLNDATFEALVEYVSTLQSATLFDFRLINCLLSGEKISQLMHAMSRPPMKPRRMHLDISENPLGQKHEQLVKAISRNLSPTHLSLRSIEYKDQDNFESLLLGLVSNTSTQSLEIARVGLPAEANKGVCKALKRLLAESETITDLDISGEDSRLEVSKLGTGINMALGGLKKNKTLKRLHIKRELLCVFPILTFFKLIVRRSEARPSRR